MSQYSPNIDAAEAELQQELREMFAVDTQQHLATYFSLVQQLNERSWTADIQHLYRAIHTVKGGAVTVGAEAMLQAAIALEDLLSDLRYLEQAPPLADRHLISLLVEAGELLSGSIESEVGAAAIDRLQPTVARLQQLQALVKQTYLPDWNELKQVHQEFAEQGFDLVILDLEIAIARMPAIGVVPAATRATAQATLAHLTQIGNDIELADGWQLAISAGDRLVNQPASHHWQQVWPEYFAILKACVKDSGNLSDLASERLAALTDARDLPDLLDDVSFERLEVRSELATQSSAAVDAAALGEDGGDLPAEEPAPAILKLAVPSAEPIELAETDSELCDLLDDLFDDESDPVVANLAAPVAAPSALAEPDAELGNGFNESDPVVDRLAVPVARVASALAEPDAELSDLLDTLFEDEESEAIAQLPLESVDTNLTEDVGELDESQLTDLIDGLRLDVATTAAPIVAPTIVPLTPDRAVATKRGIQIPVPLDRLDRSARSAIDTLLSARSVKNISTQIQSQLHQLTTLSQESSEFVGKLRQLQDDYASLRTLSDERSPDGDNVTLERYRQGYSTLNRLLENLLRMSELGQEIESAAYQNAIDLDLLDRHILRLKDGIETSRLVPFRNLTLRARAILRDLTNRYGKQAELVVENEQIELDAGIVQQLEPALLHLLRNAYDHGLETTAQRVAANKPAQGLIRLTIGRSGNRYRLTIADDGGGIDRSRIEQLAKSKGFTMFRTETNDELLAVLCQPGFSSSDRVSEVSGRGVGMDVVAAQIASIGGSLSLDTATGRGTEFTLEVPAPQLLFPCVLLQVAERTIGIPADEILETALLSSLSAEAIAHSPNLCTWRLHVDGRTVAGFDLANYWQATARSLPATAICLRTRTAADRDEVWTIADDLLGQAELLIDPLPKPLLAPVGLLGVSLQPDGRMITILDPIALAAKVMATSVSADAGEARPVAIDRESTATTILVVDDAALMRRRFAASLNNHGFVVHTCNDGLEALAWLQTNPLPNLMITDVEMPNMDGFTLIDRCRQTYADFPILVVSSRLSEDWGREALRLGASAYLNKGFSTAELLAQVNSLMGFELAITP